MIAADITIINVSILSDDISAISGGYNTIYIVTACSTIYLASYVISIGVQFDHPGICISMIAVDIAIIT